MSAAKEKGLVRSEGKEYVMKDGDIVYSDLMCNIKSILFGEYFIEILIKELFYGFLENVMSAVGSAAQTVVKKSGEVVEYSKLKYSMFDLSNSIKKFVFSDW